MTQRVGSVPQWYLGADCLATDSVIFPRSITGWDGNNLTAAEVGTTFYGVLMNKDKNKMELIQINSANLATYNTTGLTLLKRGLPFFIDGSDIDLVEVGANKLNWSAGDILLVGSNPPILYRLGMKFLNGGTFEGNYGFTGQLVFSSAKYPKVDNPLVDPIDDEDFTTKKFVLDVAAGVGVSTNRVVNEGKAGEDITAGQIIYYQISSNTWKLASASELATSSECILAIAQGSGTTGNLIVGGVLLVGRDSNQTGMTPNTIQYLSDTPGARSQTTGIIKIYLGYANSATELLFSPRFRPNLTENEKLALAGRSGELPNGTNRFIDRTYYETKAYNNLSLIDSDNPGIGVSGTTDEIVIYQKNIPANKLVYGVYEFRILVKRLHVVTAKTFILKVKYDGETMITYTSAATAGTISVGVGDFTVDIGNYTGPTDQYAKLQTSITFLSSAVVSWAEMKNFNQMLVGTAAKDSTLLKQFQVTLQFDDVGSIFENGGVMVDYKASGSY